MVKILEKIGALIYNFNNCIKKKKGSFEMTEKTRTKAILEWVYCGVIAIVIVLLIKSFIGIPTVVKQSSMYPTLKQNERLWLSKLDGFSNKVPERGDIITFEAPTDRNVDINLVNYENSLADGLSEEKYLEGKKLVKEICVPGKIVNFVVA